MRKSLIIILLLLVVSAVFVWHGTAEIYAAHDQVEFTEEILFGNPEAADGVETTFKTTYADRVFWTTTQLMGSEQGLETEYEFSNQQKPMDYRYKSQAINYYLNYVPNSYFYNHEDSPEGLPRAYMELFEETPAGGTLEKTVNLAEYVDYYPIEATFNIQKFGFSLHPGYDGSTYDHYFTGSSGYEEAVKVFNDYFKIPVLKDERIDISVNKAIDGSYSGDGMSKAPDSDSYEPFTTSALGENRCFFTIASHSTNGQQMDMSLLPDGYGIFCFDYEARYYESGAGKGPLIDTTTFRNAYPLDPSVTVCHILLNDSQTILYLFTMEEGHYWFTAIDADTFKTLVRIKAAPMADENSYGPNVYDCGDFICMDMGAIAKIAVISASPDDRFALEFTSDTLINDSHSLPSYPEPVFAFDGKRLAAGISGVAGFEQANYDLMIFTADGPQYWGRYTTSLMTGQSDENAYRYNVRPMDYNSLALKWTH